MHNILLLPLLVKYNTNKILGGCILGIRLLMESKKFPSDMRHSMTSTTLGIVKYHASSIIAM